MIVASFLTKDLLADWRHGYDYFPRDTGRPRHRQRQRRVVGGLDGDRRTALLPHLQPDDAGRAGTIPTPSTSRDTFEIRGLDADLIHEWHELSPTQRANAAPNYPAPIVDHGAARRGVSDV